MEVMRVFADEGPCESGNMRMLSQALGTIVSLWFDLQCNKYGYSGCEHWVCVTLWRSALVLVETDEKVDVQMQLLKVNERGPSFRSGVETT
eukprot:6420685-Amphidinium_carterae.1